MKTKLDPNLIFRKEQIFEDLIERLLGKSDWSTNEKLIHVRRMESRLTNEPDTKEKDENEINTSTTCG